MSFDEEAYAREVLEPARLAGNQPPANLVVRYALSLPLDPAQIAATLPALLGYWRRVRRELKYRKLVTRLEADHARLAPAFEKAKAGDVSALQAAIEAASSADDARWRLLEREIDDLAGPVRRITAELASELAVRHGLDPDQVAGHLQRAGIQITTPDPLPVTAPVTGFGRYREALHTLGCRHSADFLTDGVDAGLKVFDLVTLPDQRVLGPDDVAAADRTWAARKHDGSRTLASTVLVGLKPLVAEHGAAGLAALVQYEVADELRLRHRQGASAAALVEYAERSLGLSPDDARRLAFAVRAEPRTAPPPPGAAPAPHVDPGGVDSNPSPEAAHPHVTVDSVVAPAAGTAQQSEPNDDTAPTAPTAVAHTAPAADAPHPGVPAGAPSQPSQTGASHAGPSGPSGTSREAVPPTGAPPTDAPAGGDASGHHPHWTGPGPMSATPPQPTSTSRAHAAATAASGPVTESAPGTGSGPPRGAASVPEFASVPGAESAPGSDNGTGVAHPATPPSPSASSAEDDAGTYPPSDYVPRHVPPGTPGSRAPENPPQPPATPDRPLPPLGAYAPLPAPSHIAADRAGDEVVVRWRWPTELTEVMVRWRATPRSEAAAAHGATADATPSPPTQAAWRQRSISRGAYRSQGGAWLPLPHGDRNAPLEIELVPVAPRHGRRVTGAPITVRVPGRVEAWYEVNRTGPPWRRELTIAVRTGQRTQVRRLMVVLRRGTVMPLHASDGEILRQLDDVRLAPEEPLRLRMPAPRGPYWLRCFATDDEVELRDPPVVQLRGR